MKTSPRDERTTLASICSFKQIKPIVRIQIHLNRFDLVPRNGVPTDDFKFS